LATARNDSERFVYPSEQLVGSREALVCLFDDALVQKRVYHVHVRIVQKGLCQIELVLWAFVVFPRKYRVPVHH